MIASLQLIRNSMVTTIGLVGHAAGLIGQHHWNTQMQQGGSHCPFFYFNITMQRLAL
jgi:hypothetical protein